MNKLFTAIISITLMISSLTLEAWRGRAQHGYFHTTEHFTPHQR